MGEPSTNQTDYYRYFIELAYEGSKFCGWQYQPNGISVQSSIEDAMTLVLQKKIEIMGCGRTDTGVHATQFFAHFDLEKPIEEMISPEKLTYKLNSVLPKSIVIYQIFKVNADMHARFSAIERRYQYFISLDKNPFVENLSCRTFNPLDVEKMNKAAKLLIGKHDFQCFSKVKTSVNNFICTVTHAEWKQTGKMLVFEIGANRFLRNMVRAIVGTLIKVGEGKIEPNEILAIMEKRDRCAAGRSVSAKGLFLTEVKY